MTLRIGLITTLDTNIGDDFIRAGLCSVLRGVFEEANIDFVAVNKHKPHTAYERWHPIQTAALAKFLPRGSQRAIKLAHLFFATPGFSKFESCDAIVQCGAPVLWPDCNLCEWALPIWHRIVGRLSQKIPVLNLAAGSCYPWERQPIAVENGSDAKFLRAIHDYCRLTTVRDSLSQLLFKTLGCEVPLIACSALLASGNQKANRGSDDFILINYMPGGGHYSFGQNLDGANWHGAVKTVIQRLSRRHKIAFICHSEAEAAEAGSLAPGVTCFRPKSVTEYFTIAAQAKAGIFNRMHASVGIAGMGIPSVAVGTDTRLLMVKNIGLPSFYVGDTSAETLENEVESLLSRREYERERLLELREQTYRSYFDHISAAVGKSHASATSSPVSLAT